MKISAKELAVCGLFTALTAVGAFIKVPVPVVPFTMQTFFVVLAGLMLGSKLAALSTGAYMVLGLIGLPIFTGGGGIGYILKPTFGYIIGFCIGAYVVGKIAEGVISCSYKRLMAAVFIGLAVIYLCGTLYYYILCNFVIATPISASKVFVYCFLMFIPGDTATCILAVIISKRLKKAVKLA